jgi:Fic/DOC family N-terminal
VRAFIPPGLPPDPPVELAGLFQHLDRANQALGRLDGLTTLLPDTKFFLYLYIQKEALLSSQIEGTQSSFSDLLLFESDAEPSVPINDVEEVSNYVAAMQHGLRRMPGGFPLSPTPTGYSRHLVARGAWGQQNTGRIPPVAKLGRRNSSRQCGVCSASSRAIDGVPRRS